MSEWTFEDVQRLKVAYISGKRTKEIARILHRTPTAVNKALSRFKIRHPLKKRLPLFMAPVKKTVKKITKKRISLPKLENWITFDTLLDYLKKAGCHVGLFDKDCEKICIDGKWLSQLQAIMKANKIRLEQYKMPFKVLEVTE